MVVCKEDVRGYFTLCNFPPWAVRLMAFAVHSTNPQVEGSVYFSTHGNFGSTIMPFVYEVFTRILRLTINLLIVGILLMYCDDMILITYKSQWHNDLVIAFAQLTMLFGQNAHASEKSDSTEASGKLEREVVLIGWTINLTTNRIMVSRRNQLRANRAFFVIDLAEPLDMKHREQICSLVERYSTIFHEMKVLMHALYKMLGGRDTVNPCQPLPLTQSAITAIRLWRMFLLL